MAQVYVTGTHYVAVADTVGYFTLAADLSIGSHTMIIRALGYEPASRPFRVDTAGTIELGAIALTASSIAVEDLIVTPPCTRYRKQPPDSLRRFIRKRGRDAQGRFWDVCKE